MQKNQDTISSLSNTFILLINKLAQSLFTICALIQCSGCITTAMLTDQSDKIKTHKVTEIQSAYLSDNHVFVQFKTEKALLSKWVDMEFNHNSSPCALNSNTICTEGKWSKNLTFNYGSIPYEIRNKGVKLISEKMRLCENESNCCPWDIYLPSNSNSWITGYSVICFDNQFKDQPYKGLMALTPISFVFDFVTFPVQLLILMAAG